MGFVIGDSQRNPNLALLWRSALEPDQHCHKCAMSHVCAGDSAAGLAQAAALVHECCFASQVLA